MYLHTWMWFLRISVAAWQENGLIKQIFPLHETNALNRLQINWVRKLFTAQPLDDIAEYFGVKVALYFAWLGHYTCALGIPAIFGTILWAALYNRGQVAQDMGHVLFSLFNVAWASLYLEAWRRYSVELAFRWGTLSTPPDLLESPRPLYKVCFLIRLNWFRHQTLIKMYLHFRLFNFDRVRWWLVR